jgi:2-C-methyl-D-erythritol 2,4-cyclodiphosphate synthase
MGFYVNEMCRSGIHDSARYIDLIMGTVAKGGFKVTNVAIAIECVTPRIDPLIDPMKATIGKLLRLEPSSIGITATQGDRHEDRIRTYAVVTVTNE